MVTLTRSLRSGLVATVVVGYVSTHCQAAVLNKFLQHDGLFRTYRLYIPDAYTGDDAWPLVLNLHGLGSNATEQMTVTGMNVIADTERFLVAYPQATGNNWAQADSVGFIAAMMDDIAMTYALDSNRVYATGMSQGGAISYALAYAMPDRIAAVASVSGSLRIGGNGTVPPFPSLPSRPLPMMHIRGTSDEVAPYIGNAKRPSVENLLSAWSIHNECGEDVESVDLPDLDSTDSSTLTKLSWCDCATYTGADGQLREAELIHYRINGGGHTWPGGDYDSGDLGAINQDFNASEIIWEFFSHHELPFSPIPNPAGDYNDDGAVDAADYVIWRDSVGMPAGTLPNDADGGIIRQAQYETWKANYGTTIQSAPEQLAAVPEPGTVLLLLGGCLLTPVAVGRGRIVARISGAMADASSSPRERPSIKRHRELGRLYRIFGLAVSLLAMACCDVARAQSVTQAQDVTLLPDDGHLLDFFGESVALSGNTAIVGAFRAKNNGIESGAAYLFDVKTGEQLKKLVPDDPEYFGFFGKAVAIDENTALIGRFGGAYLFDVRTGQQRAKLIPSNGTAYLFGRSVALSGNLAIVGAPVVCDLDPGQNCPSGASYLFNAATGEPMGSLHAADDANQNSFGSSVALHGSMALIGAEDDATNGISSGGAYLFDVTTGQQLARLAPNDPAPYTSFGISLAIDDHFALIGRRGAAYLFDVDTGQQLAKISAPRGDIESFGSSVALAGDMALIAGNSAAYLFDLKTGQQRIKFQPNDVTSSRAGTPQVALSSTAALLGMSFQGFFQNTAYVFHLSVPEPSTAILLLPACLLAPGAVRRRSHVDRKHAAVPAGRPDE